MTATEIACLVESLPHGTRMVETHISWVILTDEFAYKLKKPVQYSFLDFSDLDKRQLNCQRELELNCRLAPTVYLQVVAVHQMDDIFLLADRQAVGGPIVDYALKMRRLDTAMEMDLMLAHGKIDLAYMQVLARCVADFHRTAKVISAPQQSSADGYRSDFNDILGQSAVFEAGLGMDAGARLASVATASDRFLQAHADAIALRGATGLVRDVHGDLHARNIFAYPEPIIFDCIEFNAHFRQIDVLNEVAFFCMDLEATGFEAHADAFLKAYLIAFPAMQGREDRLLFTWFKCYRANVRAKVAALRALQMPGEPSVVAEMQLYLRMMERYAAEFGAK